MARVTVEDCIEKVNNRFDLILLAAQRSRDLSNGAPMLVAKQNDKNPVVALREIADTDISLTELEENIVVRLQRMRDRVETEETDENDILARELLASQELNEALAREALGIEQPLSTSGDDLDGDEEGEVDIELAALNVELDDFPQFEDEDESSRS